MTQTRKYLLDDRNLLSCVVSGPLRMAKFCKAGPKCHRSATIIFYEGSPKPYVGATLHMKSHVVVHVGSEHLC